MPSGISAFDVETVRVREYRRVAVGSGQLGHHHFAAIYWPARYLDIGAGHPGGELDW